MTLPDTATEAVFSGYVTGCARKKCPLLAEPGFLFCRSCWPHVPARWWTSQEERVRKVALALKKEKADG